MATRVGRRLAVFAARSLRSTCAESSSSHAQGKSLRRLSAYSPALASLGTESRARKNFLREWIPQARHMSTSNDLPQVSDPQVKKALTALYVAAWSHIDEEVESLVENTLSKHPDEVLLSSWRSAQAVEQFAAILTHLRLELDELSGGKFGGEDVAEIPEPLTKALKSAFTRYWLYLDSIDEDEGYLKKKVELDLGTVLLQVKQRCTGLEPEWGEIGVLGTSGLAGSYIEKQEGI